MSEEPLNPIASLDVLYADLPDWKEVPGIPVDVVDGWLEHPMTKMMLEHWLSEIKMVRRALRNPLDADTRNWFLSRLAMAEDAVYFPYMVRDFNDPLKNPGKEEVIKQLHDEPRPESLDAKHRGDETLKRLAAQAEILRQEEGNNHE